MVANISVISQQSESVTVNRYYLKSLMMQPNKSPRPSRIGEIRRAGTRMCVCGTYFYPSDPRQKYCSKCSCNPYRINSFKNRRKRVCIDCKKEKSTYAKLRCKHCYAKYLLINSGSRRTYNTNYQKIYREKNIEHQKEYLRQYHIKTHLM